MRRTYRLTKSVAPAGALTVAHWKNRRAEIVELLRLGPVELDLSDEIRLTRWQLRQLVHKIHLDAGIREEFWESILTFKHPNPTILKIAEYEYLDGVHDYPHQD